MNKKALFFVPVLVISAVFLFGYIAFISAVKEPSDRNYMQVGEVSIDILKQEELARAQKFFVERIADYVVKDSIIELAEKGGGCEDWSDSKCDVIGTLEENYLKYFKKNFEEYLKKMNYGGDYDIVLRRKGEKFDLYFSSKDLEFIEPAKSPQFVAFMYIIDHEFKKEIDYDLGIYSKLYDKYGGNKGFEFCSDNGIKDDIKCEFSSDEIYINFELKQELLFVNPIIKFKVIRFSKLV